MLERRVFVIIKYKNNEMKISKNMKAKNKTKQNPCDPKFSKGIL